MNNMNITAVRYAPNHPITNEVSQNVVATIDGIQMSVPLDPTNRHYAGIMRQVDAGELTIADAE